MGDDVSFRHARIRPRRDGSFEIANVGTEELRINGNAVASARVELGDEIQIGAHRARRVASPPGFDLALEIEIAERAVEWRSSAGQQEAIPIGWGKRRWSWALGVAFLGAGLMVPIFGVYSSSVQEVLRTTHWLPSDNWWNSGPLVSAHATPPAGDNCTACHRVPFHRVRNQECGKCHGDVTHHAATDTEMGSELTGRRCASCHKEHGGAAAMVRRDSDFCVDCHGKLKSSLGDKTELENVRDFATYHPEFRLTLLRPQEGQQGIEWEKVRRAPDAPEAYEQSNLVFNHKVHLDPRGVDTPDGKKQMSCASCHQPDESGVAMRPIGMKEHCSACHTLQFEGVSLPHGSVEQVVNVLRGYYQSDRPIPALAIREDVMVSRRRDARRPGEPAQDTMRETANTPEEKAQRAAREVFDRTLCVVCHGDMKKEGLDQQQGPGWQVKPVRVNQAWMPMAHFSHKSHIQSKCVDCHRAEVSEQNKDVLMPGIKVCRKCHAGGRTSAGMASTCVVCHLFHVPGKPLLTPTQERSMGVIHGEP